MLRVGCSQSPVVSRRGEQRYNGRSVRSHTIRVSRPKTRRARQHGARNITGADANPPGQPFERTAEYLCNSNCGLFVLLYEIPVRIHLE